MDSTPDNSLDHQSHCTICLEDLALRTTVTLRCRHVFHLDCLGSAFNAANAMRCPVCRALEEGVWRTFPTSAPSSGRAGPRLRQEIVREVLARTQPPSGIYRSLDQGRFSGSQSYGDGGPLRHPDLFHSNPRETAHMMMGSVTNSDQASASSHVASVSSHVGSITHIHLGVNRRPNDGYSFQGSAGPNEQYDAFRHGMTIQPVGLEPLDIAFLRELIFNNRASAGSSFGHLAGAARVQQSMNFPSPPVRAMMRAANDRSSSSGLLPAELTIFQAEGSGTDDIQLPNVGEVVLALSPNVQPGDGIDGSENIMSDGEVSVEDPSE